MKMIINIFIFLIPIIGYLFTIAAFYMGSDHIPHLYAGGVIYLVSSILLLILSLLYTKYIHSKWLTIMANGIYMLYGYSALIFSLISWYNMPTGHLNSLSNTLFTLSILVMYLVIILINRNIKIKNFMTLFWILFFSSVLFIGSFSSMIHAYNSPDKISHILYGSVIYLFTTIVVLSFTFFISLHSNKFILFSTIFGCLAFLWVGLKLIYPIIVKLSDKSSILILGISILMVLLLIKKNIMEIFSRNNSEQV